MRIALRWFLNVCLLSLPALTGGKAIAQQPNTHSPFTLREDQRKLTSAFLPFLLGSRWDYRACEVTDQSDSNAPSKPCQRYSESIVVAAGSPRIVETEFTRNGTEPAYLFCPSSDPPQNQTRFWFVTTERGVFLACTEQEKDEIDSALHGLYVMRKEVSIKSPEYILPFKIGATWGGSPEDAKQEDAYYEWRVIAKSAVTVPAGSFADCYELHYEMREGTQKRWVCAGVGVVAYEYPGEVPETHYRIELMNFDISEGPKGPHIPIPAPPKTTGSTK